jgi:hypothetical protein
MSKVVQYKVQNPNTGTVYTVRDSGHASYVSLFWDSKVGSHSAGNDYSYSRDVITRNLNGNVWYLVEEEREVLVFRHKTGTKYVLHVDDNGNVRVSFSNSEGVTQTTQSNDLYSAADIRRYIAQGTWIIDEGDVDSVLENISLTKAKVNAEKTPAETEELGVFRPQLESRKVGKIRVELVDDGFPLALREVAKVMTWAQEAKGYKDHDWKNLPNAEIALAAATSRHRQDHIIQRVVDLRDIDECVDHESKLLHKAHEAFGVLAQLQLMLEGKFD